MYSKRNNNISNTLSLRRKIAQLFLLGFKGSDMSKSAELYTMIEKFGLGAVILFDQDMVHHKPIHNISSPVQLQELCASLHMQTNTKMLQLCAVFFLFSFFIIYRSYWVASTLDPFVVVICCVVGSLMIVILSVKRGVYNKNELSQTMMQ